jgi:hypothetical protein
MFLGTSTWKARPCDIHRMVSRYSGLDSMSCSFSEKDMALIDLVDRFSWTASAGGGTMLKSLYESVWVVMGVRNTNEAWVLGYSHEPPQAAAANNKLHVRSWRLLQILTNCTTLGSTGKLPAAVAALVVEEAVVAGEDDRATAPSLELLWSWASSAVHLASDWLWTSLPEANASEEDDDDDDDEDDEAEEEAGPASNGTALPSPARTAATTSS